MLNWFYTYLNKLVKVVSVTFINSCQKLLKRLQAFELMYVCDG